MDTDMQAMEQRLLMQSGCHDVGFVAVGGTVMGC